MSLHKLHSHPATRSTSAFFAVAEGREPPGEAKDNLAVPVYWSDQLMPAGSSDPPRSDT